MKIVTVRQGDTLSHIALRELGDASRWPEIYGMNRQVIMQEQQRRGRKIFARGKPPVDMAEEPQHWIFPGTELQIPSPSPTQQEQP